jgi:CheY-like chemotaxis protein
VDILIVDDNEGDVRLLEELLLDASLKVATALQCCDALPIIAKEAAGGREHPLLVVLDLNMPKMDGFSFLREIKATPWWAKCRVVIMSGSDAPEDIMSAYQLGARQYFRKPGNLQGWADAVDSLVAFMKIMD